MTFTEIPTIDLSPLRDGTDPAGVARRLTRAAEQVGFLQVTGHGVPEHLFEAMHEASRRFFALPEADKQAVHIANSTNHRGWVPAGEEVFAGATADLKEAFDLSRDLPGDDPAVVRARMLGPNQWPDLPGFAEPVTAWYEAVFGLGMMLLRAWSTGLGLAPNRLTRYVSRPPAQLRLLHYPYDPGREDRPGIGAHTDYEVLTLLRPTAPGLEVLNDEGEWIDVPYTPGAFVINIGDLMEVWTGGRFTATTHRVRKVSAERYAYPLFFTVDHDTVIAPIPELTDSDPTGYDPVHSGEHLWQQTVRTFRYLQTRHGEQQPVTSPSYGRTARV